MYIHGYVFVESIVRAHVHIAILRSLILPTAIFKKFSLKIFVLWYHYTHVVIVLLIYTYMYM